MNPNHLHLLFPDINGDPVNVVVQHTTLGRGTLVLNPVVETDEDEDCGSVFFKPDRGGTPQHIALVEAEQCHCGHCFTFDLGQEEEILAQIVFGGGLNWGEA